MENISRMAAKGDIASLRLFVSQRKPSVFLPQLLEPSPSDANDTLHDDDSHSNQLGTPFQEACRNGRGECAEFIFDTLAQHGKRPADFSLPLVAGSGSVRLCEAVMKAPHNRKINERDTISCFCNFRSIGLRDVHHSSHCCGFNSCDDGSDDDEGDSTRVSDGFTAIMVAAGRWPHLLAFLMGVKGSDSMLGSKHSNAMLEACRGGKQACVEMLLKYRPAAGEGFTVHTTRSLGNKSLLHIAASRGHARLIPFLIKNGANINALDSLHRSPIFSSTLNTEVMKVLLQYADCDLSIISNDGMSVLDVFLLANADASVIDAAERLKLLLPCLPAAIVNRPVTPRHDVVKKSLSPVMQLFGRGDMHRNSTAQAMARIIIQHPATDVHVGMPTRASSYATLFSLATAHYVHRGQVCCVADAPTFEAFVRKGSQRREPNVEKKYRCEVAIVEDAPERLREILTGIAADDPDFLNDTAPERYQSASMPAGNAKVLPGIRLIDSLVQFYFLMPALPSASVLAVLLDFGADKDALLKPKFPLLLAALSQSTASQTVRPTAPEDAACLLIERGANTNIRAGFYSLLSTALNKKRVRIAKALLSSEGCDVDADEGDPVVLLANMIADLRRSAMAAYIRKHAMQFHSLRAQQDALFKLSVDEEQLAELLGMVKEILSRSKRERDVDLGSYQVTSLLLANGSSVNELEWLEDFSNGRPLVFRFFQQPQYAWDMSCVERVLSFQQAIDNGMDIDGADDRGRTPIQYALKNRWMAMAKLLLLNGAAATEAEEKIIKSDTTEPLSIYGIRVEL